jgi:SAM-dependent methyltransferase
MLRTASLPEGGKLADFGCSNGFIVRQLRDSCFRSDAWELWGFDHSPHYVRAARERGIPGTRFVEFDLDDPGEKPPDAFDVVICLETLEHTGNYRTGVRNLARACKPGGHLLITVPNECGLPGILKFFGRMVLRREAYSVFFAGRSRWPYVWALLTGADLSRFRQPPRHGWADHLGFDICRFEGFLREELLCAGRFELVRRRGCGAGFGRLYLLRRSMLPGRDCETPPPILASAARPGPGSPE